MENKDIFDFKDLSDVPESLRSFKINGRTPKLIELFKLANSPLTVSQILIAYYRKYGVELNRTSLHSLLYFLQKKKIMRKAGFNLWELGDDA